MSIQDQVIPHIEAAAASGEGWLDKSAHFPVDALFTELDGAGFNVNIETFGTNGWQWDWWVTVEKGGKKYTLGGSGYNGGLAFYEYEE